MTRHLPIAVVVSLLAACTGGKYVDDYDVAAPDQDVTFYQPSQVTAGNESNFAPDLSENGAFVVYTSDRAGDKDIWEKRTTGGYARFITQHSADDFSGVISPDGDKIAFVSRREDAAGDIHVVGLGLSIARFTSGEGPIETISSKLTEDSSPSWYPSSEKVVFAARAPGDKVPVLMVAELKDLKAQPLGEARGDQPNVSPDGTQVAFVRGGAIYIYQEGDDKIRQVTDGGALQDGQPRFTPDGLGLVFLRYADDTNGDGKLDGDDRATAWRLDLATQQQQKRKENYSLVPLTAATFSTYSPQLRPPLLYVTLQTQEGLNIFRLPDFGQVRAPKDLASMRKLFDLQSDFYNKTYILRRAQTELFMAGDEAATAEAALFEIDWLVTNRRTVEAAWAHAKLKRNLPKQTGVVALADLTMIELDAKPLLYPDFQSELNEEQKAKILALTARTDALLKIDESNSAEMKRRVEARSMIVRAKLMAASRQYFEAATLLSKVVTDYPELQTESSHAAYYAAIITPAISDKESAIRALRNVVEKYSGERELILRASRDAVAMNEGRDDLVQALVALRTDAKGLPFLPALAHMRISDQFMKEDKPAVSANELRQIVDSYPESPEIVLEAAARLSVLEEQGGRYDAAEKMLIALMERMKSERIESSRQAQALLVNFYLRRGEAWQREDEPALAIKEYRKAIVIEPMLVGAHRGVIDATYKRKALAELEDEYERLAEDHPESAEAAYFLGYLKTYEIDEQDSPRTRLSAIDDAIDLIEDARALDSDILQIHQTLGWLYLQKGYWREVYYESGAVLASVRRSYGLLEDFVGAADPNFLELAIDSFQTAYFLSEPDSLQRVNLAQNLGQTYYELKNYQKSLSYYMQRIKQLDVIPVRDGRAEGILWRRSGRAAFQIEELELAESLQRNALGAWEREGVDTEIAYSLDALALTLRERGKFKEAIEVYDRLRRLHERLESWLNLVGTQSNLGFCAYMDGQYERALREFEAAEKTLADTDKPTEDEAASGDAIEVNLAGQASAAKGFNVFARRNLIVTFRGKIYEQLKRPDLVLAAAEEKLKLLIGERERLIDDEDKPDAVLAEEIAIQQNLLASLYLTAGRHTESRGTFQAAAETAKLLRPEDQTYMGPGEQVNEVNRARVELRLLRLGLMTAAEADVRAKELEANAAAVKPVLEEGAKGQAKPMGQMLSLSASLQRVGGTAVDAKSYATQLDESLALMRRGEIKPSNRDGVLLAFAQAPDGAKWSDETTGFVGTLAQAAAADPRLEWRMHVAQRQYDKAFEALDRFVLAGYPLSSPTDRLTAREVMEALLADASDDQARLLLVRRYLLLRFTDLAQQAFGVVKDGKVELQRAAQKLLTLKEAAVIGKAAGPDAAILTVHRTLTGQAHAYLQLGDTLVSASEVIADADRLNPASYSQLLAKASLNGGWPAAGARVYIVPVGELYDVPWETVTVGGEPLTRRYNTAYLPVPDMLVELAAVKKLPKLSLGHVGVGPLAPAVAAANSVRDYLPVIPVDDQAMAPRLPAFNLLHIDLPLLLNDVEPGESALRGSPAQTAVSHQQDVTLRQLAALDLSETAGIVLSNVQRYNRDLAGSSEGRDGWVLLTMAAGAAGVPTVVAAEGGAPDWAKFYQELTKRSIGEAAHLAALPARVLGYAGIHSTEEEAFATEQLTEVAEEIKEIGEDDLALLALLYKRQLALQLRLGQADEANETRISLVGTLYSRLDYVGALHFKKAILAKLKPTGGEDDDAATYGEELIEGAVLAVRGLQFEDAEKMLSEAEPIMIDEDENAQLGKIYHYRGINLQNQKRYEETIEAYKKSREYFTKANPQQATARLLDIGTVYRNFLSNYAEAIEYYDQAAEEYKAQGNAENYLPVLIDKANTLMTIGQLEETIGIMERIVIPALDKEQQRTLWVRATQILANAYFRAGMFQEAQTLNDRALVEVAKIPSELSRVDRELDARSLKGMIFGKVGKYGEAFKEFKDAIDIAKKYKIKYQIALLYNNYGYWAREYGQVDQAIEFFNIALRLDEERKSRADIAYDQRNLGLAVILKGDFNRARDLLNEALKVSQELRLVYNEAYCHFGLGDVAMREEKWPEAADHFSKALAVSRQGYMMDFIWRAHAGIAAAVLKQGDLKAARTSYNESVSLIEKLRAGLKSEAGANAFYSEVGVQEVYEAFADVLMQLGDPQLAWQANERARGRAFLDSIGTQKIRFAKEESRRLMDEERELKAEIESVERRMSQAADRQRAKKDGGQVPPKLKDAMASASSRYAELIAKIKQSDAQLTQFVKVDVVSLKELGELIPPDTAMVQYLVTAERLHMWVVKGGKLEAATVDIPEVDLHARVRDYRDLIQNYSTTDYLGKELYELLIAPIRKHLDGASRLAIVPHGNLHFVAFASLPEGEQYLVDQFPVYYLDAATVARFMPKERQFNKDAHILALAAPTRPDGARALSDLPFTVRETDVMRRYFGNVDRRSGADATEAAVLEAADRTDVLHVASHSEFLARAPADSKLLLAASSGADGDLTVNEVFTMQTNASMVTLSACESGMGRLSSADEVIGLNRAFFYAGADSVVSSLWRINDVASAVVMKRFYRYLAEGDDKAEAMRKSQQVVRKYFDHPAYWSAFRIVGDYL